MTDAAMLISKSLAKLSGGGYMGKRYADIVYPDETPEGKEDGRTPQEVTEHMLKKLHGGG